MALEFEDKGNTNTPTIEEIEKRKNQFHPKYSKDLSFCEDVHSNYSELISSTTIHKVTYISIVRVLKRAQENLFPCFTVSSSDDDRAVVKISEIYLVISEQLIFFEKESQQVINEIPIDSIKSLHHYHKAVQDQEMAKKALKGLKNHKLKLLVLDTGPFSITVLLRERSLFQEKFENCLIAHNTIQKQINAGKSKLVPTISIKAPARKNKAKATNAQLYVLATSWGVPRQPPASPKGKKGVSGSPKGVLVEEKGQRLECREVSANFQHGGIDFENPSSKEVLIRIEPDKLKYWKRCAVSKKFISEVEEKIKTLKEHKMEEVMLCMMDGDVHHLLGDITPFYDQFVSKFPNQHYECFGDLKSNFTAEACGDSIMIALREKEILCLDQQLNQLVLIPHANLFTSEIGQEQDNTNQKTLVISTNDAKYCFKFEQRETLHQLQSEIQSIIQNQWRAYKTAMRLDRAVGTQGILACVDIREDTSPAPVARKEILLKVPNQEKAMLVERISEQRLAEVELDNVKGWVFSMNIVNNEELVFFSSNTKKTDLFFIQKCIASIQEQNQDRSENE
eukprot:TRINITY_DN10409_c0_g1_i2.p1 TRINITY_DN10409_c0_g1~~TRINITY_DN10409_c0_g1_i2.p1  ORF type:complete len:565 (-),score=157.06 TRINITY_DN10409_c0_g1_i2:75-1769(-)